MTFRVINRTAGRLDAYEKVTGRARYTGDIAVPGALHGKVLRAGHPSALIRRLDAAAARALPGVAAVLTAVDVPCNLFGKVRRDQQLLAKERTCYIGDGVALAAAETEEAALEALEAIRVDYEELPGLFDTESAGRREAPPVQPDWPGNEVVHHQLDRGDVEKGFAGADVVIEREYTTPFIEHAYLEPEAVIAVPEEDGTLTIRGSIAHPFACREALAGILGLSKERIRIVLTFLGGAFGGRDETMTVLAARASLLALSTGRPVKMVYSREESFLESYKRHPYRMKYKVGATRDGRLTAEGVSVVADSGCYVSQTPFVAWRSLIHATGPYEIPNVRVDIRGVYTNNIYTSAMRGYGAPQVVFAHETLMDELAAELKLPPLKLRLENILRDGSETACGQRLNNHTVSLEEVITRAAAAAGYEEKHGAYAAAADGEIKKGIGLAISYRGCNLGAEAADWVRLQVRAHQDGTVDLLCGLVENGQGLETLLCQIAAEDLGLDASRVRYVAMDTALIPENGPTVASRSTFVGGNAVLAATKKLKERLGAIVAARLGCSPEALDLRDGRFVCRNAGDKNMPFREAVRLAASRGMDPVATGYFEVGGTRFESHSDQNAPYLTYVYGCQIAEVEVDAGTGQVRVLNLTAAHDVGRAINPQGTAGQITGGVMMALGYALTEEFYLERGRPAAANFDGYLVPTARDMPAVTPVIVENADPGGPFGAKSIGEPSVETAAAAIGNAIFQAAGNRIRDLPFSLERVLLGQELRKRGKA